MEDALADNDDRSRREAELERKIDDAARMASVKRKALHRLDGGRR